MKVAYFIGRLNRGGTETLVLDTFRRKEAMPYESILVYRSEGELSEAYRATGVPMFRIKPTGLKLGYIPKLRRLLRKEGVDILHTQTHLNAFLGIFCTCFSKTKLVVSFHGFTLSALDWVYTQLGLWCADASIFVSKYVQDWYLKRSVFAPGKRCQVVYNGIDFSKFDESYETPDFLKKEDGVSSETVKMVMVGNFSTARSPILLCQALKALKERGLGDVKLYLVGKKTDADPEVFDNCVSYCRENGLLDTSVCFMGGRSDVPTILQYMDAFVYATNRDTFGIAVIEAVASGLPAIVNDWEVMKEVTNNGEWASLYKTMDIDDCADKIETFLKHKEQRKEAAQRNAEAVRQRFSIENHIRNLNEVYEKTMKE